MSVHSKVMLDNQDQILGRDSIVFACLMLQAWVGHPYFDVVDNSTGFEGKIARMISVSEKCLGFLYYFFGAGGVRGGDMLENGMF